MLIDYIELINQQRINNPLHKKDYRLINIPKYNTEFNTAINELNKYPNAFIVNIIKRDTPLYKNTTDIFYYEFVDIGVGYNTTLKNWKYFYIPISEFTNIQNRVPSFNYYDVEISDRLINQHLTFNTMFINNNLNNDYSLNSNKEQHPLLKNFIFTGGCSLLKNGTMVYEYKDYKEYTDEQSVSYLSNIAPINVYIKSSYLEENQFSNDPTLENIVFKPPSKLNLYNLNLQLEYTGRSTNERFSSHKKWYEYYAYVNGFVEDQIILPYKPTDKNLNFVNIYSYNKNMGINLPQSINTQSLSINQTSINKIIKIKQ